MKAEILAPAGNQEALKAAVAAGADAVYFGLPLFGARAFAKNFTLEQAGEIIQQAHLEGVKIYITMNTLLEEDQMETAFDWARQLYEMGVDALIIQDLGLLHLLHTRLPELELHASTQLSVSTPFQIEQLKKLGVKRVVLAREATLEEIEACAKTGMELEVFVHGALCISYSGQCQFSAVRYGRSGNKGACAQPCRMEYTLLENGRPIKTQGNYLLSPRDLSVLEQIPRLEKAGVASLKIEGRMKSPEYVYEAVTKARKAQEGKKLSAQDQKELMSTFNRGYTLGHAFEQQGMALMNPKTSNHQGIPLGEVVRVTPDKISILLTEDLHQNDGIRLETRKGSEGFRVNFLYDIKGSLIKSARAGQTVQVKSVKGVYPKAKVSKTIDYLMEKEVENKVSQTRRQSDVTFKAVCEKAGEPLDLWVSDGIHTAHVQEPVTQKAQKRPTDRDTFVKQLSKTGNTWARAAEVVTDIPQDLFVPLPAINSLRTRALEALEKEKLKVNAKPPLDYHVSLPQPAPLKNLVQVLKPHQAIENEDYDLVSEFPLEHARRKAGLKQDQGYVSAHLADSEIVDGMNITNSYALAALLLMGYKGAVLSEELGQEARKKMLEAFSDRYGFSAPVIKTVYEHPRLMVMNHCPVNTALKDGTRRGCSLCRTNDYELEGKDGSKVFLYGNPQCQMCLYDENALDQIDQIGELKEQGISNFRVSLTKEDAEQSRKVLERFLQKAANGTE